jgi:DNA polymerase III epsilon subunit-like protein
MSWAEQQLVGFDIESTSADPETARIVTACVVQVGGGLPTDTAEWLADPGVEIPAEATAVHGVSTERARAEGAPAAEVVESLVAALAQVVAAGVPIVAMNARYDVTVLDREARRYGVTPLTDVVGDGLRVLDPLVIDKAVDTYRRGKRTLTALCQRYEVPLDGAHDATQDAVAACRVVWRQARVYPALAEMDLAALHAAQVEWAAQQAASLQEYFRRKDPTAVVEPAWPLVPVKEAV